MSEASGSDKRAIQHQSSAMSSSVINQEKAIAYLRSLDLPLDDEPQAKSLAETIDALQQSRKDLVDYLEYIGVAHDFGWDAAKIYRDEPDDAVSKRIQSAVSKAKKKRESAEKDKKKKKAKRSSSSSSGSSHSNISKRSRSNASDKSGASCSHAAASACCSGSQNHYHSGYVPYHQRQFRAGQNLPCIRCGDTAHHWRQCPKPATK